MPQEFCFQNRSRHGLGVEYNNHSIFSKGVYYYPKCPFQTSSKDKLTTFPPIHRLSQIHKTLTKLVLGSLVPGIMFKTNIKRRQPDTDDILLLKTQQPEMASYNKSHSHIDMTNKTSTSAPHQSIPLQQHMESDTNSSKCMLPKVSILFSASMWESFTDFQCDSISWLHPSEKDGTHKKQHDLLPSADIFLKESYRSSVSLSRMLLLLRKLHFKRTEPRGHRSNKERKERKK